MKSFLKILILVIFSSNYSPIYSDEFDDFVGKIIREPENMFTYLCDTNYVNPVLIKQLERYQSNYQKDKEILNECKTIKLKNKEINKSDSVMSYNFYYDFLQYNKVINIWFYFNKEYKSRKMKLESFFIFGIMNDGFIKRIIDNPDSLNYYIKDTNYIDNMFWELKKMKLNNIDSLGDELKYIKKNKLKQKENDLQLGRGYYYVSYNDPKNNSAIELLFFFGTDEKSGKCKIRSMDAKRYYEK